MKKIICIVATVVAISGCTAHGGGLDNRTKGAILGGVAGGFVGIHRGQVKRFRAGLPCAWGLREVARPPRDSAFRCDRSLPRHESGRWRKWAVASVMAGHRRQGELAGSPWAASTAHEPPATEQAASACRDRGILLILRHRSTRAAPAGDAWLGRNAERWQNLLGASEWGDARPGPL